MQVIKKVIVNNIYTLEGFDVSVEEWKKMLVDSSIFNDKALEMVKRWYYEDDHASSSKIMVSKYNPELTSSPYNGIVVGLGKKILQFLNRYEIETDDGRDSYYVTVFDGWYENNHFIWKLKDNICKALEELNYVGDVEKSRPKFWLFPSNLEYYNVYGAFEQYDELYWRQNLNNIKVGDKVFIYIGKPESKIAFYCDVIEANVNQDNASSINDSIFYLGEESLHEKYVKIKLLKRLYDNRFNLQYLKRNGLKGNIQNQQEVSKEVLNSILELINYSYLDEKEIQQNIDIFKYAYLEEEQDKFKVCELERLKFIEKFTITNLSKMTLKDYCLGLDTDDNFCYFLETRLRASGSIKGGSAYKFGVFYSREHKKFEILNKWSKNEDENEALTNIKNKIIELIEAGKLYDLYTLENNKLATVVKGKILATYYPNKYLGIFGDEDFDYFFYKLNIPYNEKISTVRKQYQLLKLKQENKIFDCFTFDEFMSFLYNMYGNELRQKKKEDNKKYFKKNNYDKSDEIDTNKKIKQKLVKENYDFIGNTKKEKTIRKIGVIDYESLHKKRTAIGLTGEELVVNYETELLKSYGLKLRPEHVAKTDSSAGYDIISYDEYGNIKYIEVKTRKGKNSTKLDFYITANEKEKFETLKGYVIYFVSDLNNENPKLRIVTKDIYDQLELEPIAYHVKAEIKVIE